MCKSSSRERDYVGVLTAEYSLQERNLNINEMMSVFI